MALSTQNEVNRWRPFHMILQVLCIRMYLTMNSNCVNLLPTFTTVFPLTVVFFMVKPGVPPNAGLFL
jgi:hypothetical protein